MLTCLCADSLDLTLHSSTDCMHLHREELTRRQAGELDLTERVRLVPSQHQSGLQQGEHDLIKQLCGLKLVADAEGGVLGSVLEGQGYIVQGL